MKTKFLLSLLFPIVPLLYVSYQWNQIPQNVPLHFDLDTIPNRFGTKTELLIRLLFQQDYYKRLISQQIDAFSSK